MGNIVASKCTSCGFSNKFRYGGGRFSYQTDCPVPAINKETLEFENINYLEPMINFTEEYQAKEKAIYSSELYLEMKNINNNFLYTKKRKNV